MANNNYKGKGRNRRGSKPSKPKCVSEDKEHFEQKHNDASWYTVPGQLTKDVASLSFNNATGISYNLGEGVENKLVTPGIMSIYMSPIPGVSFGASSAVNIAAKNLYSWVRHANSGHSNYDSPDLMLYVLAMDSAFAYYAWMARIYGVLRVYDQRNRYLGMHMAQAMGVNYSDMISHLAAFRSYINQYAVKLGAFNVPTSMSLFKRHMWMFNNVYADEDNVKGQFYMYNPAYLYMYEEQEGAGKLVPQSLCLYPEAISGDNNFVALKHAPLRSLDDIIGYGERLINALVASEDINIMSGDILKAYDGNVYKLTLIGEDYAVAPVFSEEVLSQIHNTIFAGNRIAKPVADDLWSTFNVTQTGTVGYGAILCQPSTKDSQAPDLKILDFWKNDVTPDDVIVATRNMIHQWYDEIGARWTIQTAGTEVPMFATIYTLNEDGNTMTGTDVFDSVNYATVSRILTDFSTLNFFNEHPLLYAKNNNKFDAKCVQGEVSNYTLLDLEDLRKMHDTALLSMLAVPLLGNVART